MHDPLIRNKAVTLVRAGASNADVARKLDVPAGTISYWVHMDRPKTDALPGWPVRPCPRCDGRDLDEGAYSYLLALYLGDGYIVQHVAASRPQPRDHVWQ